MAAELQPAPNVVDAHVEVTLENFGPVRRGTITLKPLTVLIGPNNAGKSFAALAVLAAARTVDGATSLSPESALDPSEVGLGTHVVRLRPAAPCREAPATIDLRQSRWAQIWGDATVASGYLAKQLEELGRDAVANATGLTHGPWRLDVGVQGHGFWVDGQTRCGWFPELAASRLASGRKPDLRMFAGASDAVVGAYVAGWEIGARLPAALARGCVYLPAARSGLRQAYKYTVSLLLRSASAVTRDAVILPPMLPVLADFIEGLVSIEPGKPGPWSDLTKELEPALLGGRLVPTGPSAALADFELETTSGRFPLDHVSSSVAELAPLMLYLRYVVPRDALLIVEEPEAHLHPELQAAMARMLARLVNAGLRVLITTHSDYLLAQLSNQLLAGSFPSAARGEGGLHPTEKLRLEQVAVHLHERVDGTPAYDIQDLPLSADEGIPQDSLTRVAEALYHEGYQLAGQRDAAKGRAGGGS